MRSVIIVFSIFSSVSQPAPCPHGWVNRGPSCYAFITDAPDGWTEAESFCNLLHSRLVEIETVVEDEYLRVHLMDNKITDLHEKNMKHRPSLKKTAIEVLNMTLSGGFGAFWIGMTDILVEGEWVWMSTQTTPHYTNWWPGQPDNYHAEDCAFLYSGYSFKWNDAPCLSKFNFICEKESSHGEENVIG